ncbi:hypothetical protein ACQ4PT_029595 [Festuca glaucescens]
MEKLDDTNSHKSSKKADGKSSDKSRRKRKEGDQNSDKSEKKKKKKRKLGSDWVHLPHLPVPIIWGRRSKHDAVDKTWTCACGTTNYATRHVFIDLPSFKCTNDNCDEEPAVIDFCFSLGNLTANGVCLIGDIYYQKDKPDCFVFALAKGCEIAVNIRNILSGNGKLARPINPYSFKKHLEEMQGGVELAKIEYGSAESRQRIWELLATEGIKELGGQNVYKFETVDCNVLDNNDDALDPLEEEEAVNKGFEALATALANGSPVITNITLGRNFGALKYGKVYKAPKEAPIDYETDSDKEGNGGEEGENKRKVSIVHSVVLVGAARKGNLDYYYFLNSYGVHFCVRVDRDTRSTTCGIGKICAEDASFGSPFKILLFA